MRKHPAERNADMARAIQTLRRGESIGQQDEAMQRKAAMVGFQAMLGAVGHSIQADGSRKLQEQQKNRSIMSGAIDDATRKAAALRSAPSVPNAPPQESYGDEYGLPRQMGPVGPSYDKQMNASVQAGNPDWLKEKAKEASDTQSVNIAAAGANIGGYRTPSGADDIDVDSDGRAADLQTGKNIMKATQHMGGMMGSLARR